MCSMALCGLYHGAQIDGGPSRHLQADILFRILQDHGA
jgi:hypothetical protein